MREALQLRYCKTGQFVQNRKAIALTAILVLLWLGQSLAQAQLASSAAGPSEPASPTPTRYLYAVGLPQQAKAFRTELPGLFDKPGHERRTLSGTVTRNGSSLPFVFTRELDQNVRLDLGQRSYIVTCLNSRTAARIVSTGTGIEGDDSAILETLAEDSTEGLLFSFGTATRMHWIGGGYRIDGGSDAHYTGPHYDIYAESGQAGTQTGSPARIKTFLFDSTTKLLAYTRYRIESGGTPVEVEVSFNNWTPVGGQMTPTSISRSENGQPVFTIAITASSSSPAQQDSLFGPGTME